LKRAHSGRQQTIRCLLWLTELRPTTRSIIAKFGSVLSCRLKAQRPLAAFRQTG
jgi:hypothetical protein